MNEFLETYGLGYNDCFEIVAFGVPYTESHRLREFCRGGRNSRERSLMNERMAWALVREAFIFLSKTNGMLIASTRTTMEAGQ